MEDSSNDKEVVDDAEDDIVKVETTPDSSPPRPNQHVTYSSLHAERLT